jgi:predicted amidohydrolase YtcJ
MFQDRVSILFVLVFLLVMGAPPAQAQTRSPDLILTNGRVFTATDDHAFAESLAIQGDRIIAVGTNQQISALAGPSTRRIDVGGRLVIPGFNDAHIHTSPFAKGVDLRLKSQEATWQEVTEELARVVSSTPKGTIIYGRVSPRAVDSGEANRRALDDSAPEHPVVVTGGSGHTFVLNTAAMKKLGIRETEPDPLGGRFERDSGGRLTGPAFEYAAFRIQRALSSVGEEKDAVNSFHKLSDLAVRLGITSVQDMPLVEPERFVSILAKSQPSIRVRIMRFPPTNDKRRITEEGMNLARAPLPNVTVSGTKYVLDGTPIEWSSAMRQPYSDNPKTRGWMDFTEKEMEGMLRESLKSGDQLLVHIVGDQTVEIFLEAMEATGGKAVWAQRRVRIEHGNGITIDLLPRVKALGIVVGATPVIYGYHDLQVQRLGADRAERMLLLRSLWDAGIPVAIGSDGPFNPFRNLMTVTDIQGRPGESLTREQAVIAYTRTPAYAEFAEKDKGTLERGKLADLAVLSQDVFRVPSADLPKTESLLTLVGGRVVYSAGPLTQK